MRQERTKALSCGAAQFHSNSVVCQAGMAVAFGDFAGQHGTDSPIQISNHSGDGDFFFLIQCGRRLGNQFVIERLSEAVVLGFVVQSRDILRHCRHVENLGEVQTLCFPMTDAFGGVEQVCPADQLVK